MAKKSVTQNKTNEKLSAEEKIKKLSLMADSINKSSNSVVCGFIDNPDIIEKLTLKFIPTPNPDFNEAVGGGFPAGRCTIITGKEDSGKTSFILETIGKNMQKDENFVALWLESEQSITDMAYLTETFGIDPKRFLFITTDLNNGAEVALDRCEALLRVGGIDLFCINSMRALVPKTELNKSITEDTVALQARLNTKMLKKFLIICYENDIAFPIIQHLTTSIGTMSRDPYILGGGLFMKYGGLLIADMRKQSVLDSDPITKEEGMKICISIKKNHITPRLYPYVKVNHYVIYGEGTEVIFTTLNKAIDQGILTKAGAWINWPAKELKWCGKQEFRKYMKENPDDLQTLQNLVTGVIEDLSEEELQEINEEEKINERNSIYIEEEM